MTCCTSWIGDLVRDHARRLAAAARHEGLSPTDALEISTCIAKLGDVHRHVITLRVLEELSGQEAADALGVTANHVGVLLHRARKALAACLTAQQ